jgi:aminoglycoside phosphotransferase (APT) family kinase protein
MKPPFSFLDSLPQLLMQTFGSDATNASYQVLNQHEDYCVLLVDLGRPSSKVIVKLAGRGSTMDADFERTAFLHKLVRTETRVPIAEILAVDSSYQTFPWRYLIQSHLSGTIWAELAPQLDAKQKYGAFEQMGDAVGQLHSIQFPTFGSVESDAGVISFIDALLQRAERTIQWKAPFERFVDVVRTRSQLFETVHQAVLCHDDLHHYNLLFQHEQANWKLAAILDFDKAWAGHSETDLARLDFWDNMMGDGFRAAYMAQHKIEAAYEERKLIYQLLWCLEYAATTPRHLADLQRLAHTLNIKPIVL